MSREWKNAEEARVEFWTKMSAYGLYEEAEIEATKQDIIKMMPPALVESMEGASEYEIAMAGADAYFAAKGDGQGGGDSEPNPTKTEGTKPEAYKVSAEQREAILMYTDSLALDQQKRSDATRVVNILCDKPVFSQLFISGSQLMPKTNENTEAKFNEHEKILVQDPENIERFNRVKNAVLHKQPMEVYINTKQTPKTIGWRVETLDDKLQPITIDWSVEDAKNALMIQFPGLIQPKADNQIGLYIRWRDKPNSAKNRAKDNESGSKVEGTTVVMMSNRKALENNPNMKVITSQIAEESGQKVINSESNAYSADYYVITTTIKNTDGSYRTRTVRAQGKTSAYKVERKAEFIPTFGSLDRKASTGLGRKAMQDAKEATIKGLASMLNSDSVTNAGMKVALANIRRGMKQSATDFQ